MKKNFYILLLFSLLYGCASSKKLLQEGHYNQAIIKSAAALRRKPNDSEQLHILKSAYQTANMFTLQKIEFLKKENRPENAYHIYQLYSELNNRENIIRSLPIQDRSQFTLANYDNQIIQAKRTSANYFYQQGLQYLNAGGRQNARRAFQKFIQTRRIYNNYKNINHLLNEAHFAGMTNVLFRIKNESNEVLPKAFYYDIQRVNLRDLDSRWLTFYTLPDSTVNYSYYIVLDIHRIHFTPEIIDKKSFTMVKRIQDGMKYVLNAKGNVKRDSSGNDIKVPRMVNAVANVTEIIQHKQVTIDGTLNFLNLQTHQLAWYHNISAGFIFDHRSERMSGNRKALSDRYRKMLYSRPVRFPSNKYMLLQTTHLLKEKAKNIIYYNQQYLSH